MAKRKIDLDAVRSAYRSKVGSSWALEDLDVEHRPLGDMHPGSAAVTYVREALADYDIPGTVDLRYTSMDRQAGSGAHQLRDGVVHVHATVRAQSGVPAEIDFPIIVRDGHMLYPELLQHHGQLRVTAQSTFDDILNRNEIFVKDPVRGNMFSPPPDDGESMADQSEYPRAQSNMYQIRTSALDEPTRYLQEAERDRSSYLSPGASMELAHDLTVKNRGGGMTTIAAGTKGRVLRDMFGTGDTYYCEFESGMRAPVHESDLA